MKSQLHSGEHSPTLKMPAALLQGGQKVTFKGQVFYKVTLVVKKKKKKSCQAALGRQRQVNLLSLKPALFTN